MATWPLTGRKTLREYETTFIVQPEISDEGSQAILAKLDGILETGGATRLMCEDHGKRKLAYEDQQISQGSLLHPAVPDEGQVVPDLERVLRLEESVLRFLTILADEEVADVEARRPSLPKRKTSRPSEPQSVAARSRRSRVASRRLKRARALAAAAAAGGSRRSCMPAGRRLRRRAEALPRGDASRTPKPPRRRPE